LRDCGDGYAVGCLQFGFERVQGVAAARRDDQVAAFGCVVRANSRPMPADAPVMRAVLVMWVLSFDAGQMR